MTEIKTDPKNTYQELATVIVAKQASIIGEKLAFEKAWRVEGVRVDSKGRVVQLAEPQVETLGRLIDEYARLSGESAVKFSQQAVDSILQKNPDLPLPEQLKKGYSPMEHFLASF